MAPGSGRGRGGSTGNGYTWEKIKEVQSLIERCMQHYMTQTEIIATLQVQEDIDPSLTCLVWQKLEEQNADFFLSYSACLRLKDQIACNLRQLATSSCILSIFASAQVAFNYLVEQQTRLLQKLTNSLPPESSAQQHTDQQPHQQQVQKQRQLQEQRDH